MYLPDPLFELVLGYLTDGQPARRVLLRSEPALGRALGRDWGETRRVVEIVAYTLRRETQREQIVRMLLIIGDERFSEMQIANLLRCASPRAKYPLKYTWGISCVGSRFYLVYHDHLNCSSISCEILKSDENYPLDGDDYRDQGYSAVFVCGDLFIDRDDMRSVHNGRDRFVV
jgi:hypothetical protein